MCRIETQSTLSTFINNWIWNGKNKSSSRFWSFIAFFFFWERGSFINSRIRSTQVLTLKSVIYCYILTTIVSVFFKFGSIKVPGSLHCILDQIIFFFGLFRVTPVAYGSSQARGQIGAAAAAAAAAYTTATARQDLTRISDLHHSSGQHQILNPLSEARDQTQILTDTMLGS